MAGTGRKHIATGKPKGGHRAGAGRKPGSPNALGYGEVKAVKSLRWRVPEAAPEPVKDLADLALETIAQVMRGEVSYLNAAPRLKAATTVRAEVCGPPAQKVEHAVRVTLEQLVAGSFEDEDAEGDE